MIYGIKVRKQKLFQNKRYQLKVWLLLNKCFETLIIEIKEI